MRYLKKFTVLILFLITVSALAACNYFTVPKTTVNFYDGDELVSTVSVRDVSAIVPPTLPDRNGYTVVGWREKDGSRFFSKDYDFKETNDFVAVWGAKTYKISYDLDGGVNDAANPSDYSIEDSFVLKDARKEGYDFLGWTLGDEVLPVRNYPIERGTFGDLDFKAVFGSADMYYIYFDTNGGSAVERAESANGVFSSAPAAEKDGYDLEGWYVDDKLTYKAIFPYITTKRLTVLYAKWKAKTYHVYSTDSSFETISFTPDTESFFVVANERTGYRFVGFSEEGSDAVRSDFCVEKGSHRDYYLSSHYEPERYVITFNSMGGSAVDPIEAYYGETIVAPADPVRAYCDFTGWYVDKDQTELFVFDVMPAKSFTVYAGWQSEYTRTLSYSATLGSTEIECNYTSGSKIIIGDRVVMSAPVYSDGGSFVFWSENGSVYSYSDTLEFDMGEEDLSLVANYGEANTYVYDKSVGGDYSIVSSYTLTGVYGESIRRGDYSISSKTVTIRAEYLSSLDDGYYPYMLQGSHKGESKSEYFILRVTGSADVLKNVKIDYDVNYPDATLLFDGAAGARYEYSLDGSAFVEAESGIVLYGYLKNLNHTVTVRNKADSSDRATVVKKAYKSGNSEFVDRSFTYGGNTYDCLVEDKSEFDAMMAYIVFVYAPTSRSGPSSDYPGGTATFTFGLSDEFYEALSSDDSLFKEIFNEEGVPYSPSYSYSVNSSVTRCYATFTVSFKSSTPNEVRSDQPVEPVSDAQKLLKSSSRSPSFNDFPIDSFTKTQKIRTLYELEALPYGVRPIFDGSSSLQAREVYEKAKDVLRAYVSDDMNDFEKVVAIYDYLSLNITYDDVAAASANSKDISKYRSFTSYGALVDGVAVCDGIESAFAILCKIEGIECADIAGDGNGGAHAWNKVKVYGKWYAVDVTWSHVRFNSELYVTHRYLIMDEATCAQKHVENATGVAGEEYTKNAAISPLNYYNIVLINGKYDFTADSTEDFANTIKALYLSGATFVEIKVAESVNIALAKTRAEAAIMRSVNCTATEDGVYIVTIG